MKNIVALFMVVIVLLIVPSGFYQVHAYIQQRENVQHTTANLTMYLSKKGTLDPNRINQIVADFLQQEIGEKALPLNQQKMKVQVTRVDGISDHELTAYDTFRVRVTYPKPWLAAWMGNVSDITVEMIGTMEPLPPDKEGA